MHSSLNRLQTTFGFFTTCAFTLAGIIALLSLLPIPTPASLPTASLTPKEIQVSKGRPHYYSSKREEHASIRFDLDADLSGLFTWNTKQLFIYVTANYPTTGDSEGKNLNLEEFSESVIWDQIIPSPSTPWSYQNLKNTYFPDAKTRRAQKLEASRKSKNKNKKTTTETKDLVKPGVLRLRNQKPKYQLTDPSGQVADRQNVTLQLHWNVQPWVGALVWDVGYLGSRTGSWGEGRGKAGRSGSFSLPGLKGKEQSTGQGQAQSQKRTPPEPEAGEGKPLTEI